MSFLISFKKSTCVGALTLLALSSQLAVSASLGVGAGGGGLHSCAEYTDLAGKIASTLVTIGQTEVNKVNAVVQVQEVWHIIQHPLRCVPVESLDRDAMSYPDEVKTELLWSRWDQLTMFEKIRLTTHELAVLARYEMDGQYFISKDVQSIIEKKSEFFMDYSRAVQVTHNSDGTTTFVEPLIRDRDGNPQMVGNFCAGTPDESVYDASESGFCRYLGLKELRTFFGTDKGSYSVTNCATQSSTITMADLSAEGYVRGFFEVSNRPTNLVLSVTCR